MGRSRVTAFDCPSSLVSNHPFIPVIYLSLCWKGTGPILLTRDVRWSCLCIIGTRTRSPEIRGCFLDELDRGETVRLVIGSGCVVQLGGTHWQIITCKLVNVSWQFGTEIGDCCVKSQQHRGRSLTRLLGNFQDRVFLRVNSVARAGRRLLAPLALESMVPVALVGHSSQCPAPPQIRNQHLKSHLQPATLTF